MNNHINTLFELLEKYEVKIPIIQRDYAQGRNDEHAKMVRLNLLKDLKSAVLNETDPINLSFIYGKVEENKFIPLDGQQRLTTLFLLYIYTYSDDDSKTGLFKRFTYETRKSSRDFLEKLVENRKFIFKSKEMPSNEIKDSEWFLSKWKYDPTIQSALVMLDYIKNVFADVDNLASRISGENIKPIIFDCLDIKAIGAEDDVYIRLNARGRALTSFENFKARLIGKLKESDVYFSNNFEQLFDGKWTDLFWSKSRENFDHVFLDFFGVLFMNNGICNTDINWADTFDFSKVDSKIFKSILYTLNFLVDNPNCEEVHKCIFGALTEKHTYENRLLFHVVTSYMDMSKGLYNDSLKQWIRILKNLILNSNINGDSYRRFVSEINKLKSNWNDLLEYFSNGGKVEAFLKEQIEEEKIKAKLIISSKVFEEAIYKAEKHPYFSGQISSALYYAKNEQNQYDVKIFEDYWNKIAALFDDKKPKYEIIMRQALLALGDYTLKVDSYKTLCVNDPKESASTPSMKRLFSNHGEIAKQLLDKLNISNGNSIEKELMNIIKASNLDKNDWRYCFIRFPELFDFMSKTHLRIREVHGDFIIVRNKLSSGFNYDIFLISLMILLKKKGIEAEYCAEYGASGNRYLKIGDNNLEVQFKKGQYIISNQDKKYNSIDEIAQDIISNLLKNTDIKSE